MCADIDDAYPILAAPAAQPIKSGANLMLEILPMSPSDWPDVRTIYAEGIATGQATFESTVPDWDRWDRSHLASCRLVAKSNGAIVGWAALSPVSSRKVYEGVAEVSVYVASTARGKGIGRRLLDGLVDQSESNGIWTLQASVFPENEASIALHRACGFRIVGRRERIALHNGVWRDTFFLERRSSTAGVEL
ncbi:MAG TPA: GNAT family N-acetyltransferase [Gemmatimonadaceae bacterium]|nr:GNAT family N-acetyltransferase [Gemmatimonadaceae bacterium]